MKHFTLLLYSLLLALNALAQNEKPVVVIFDIKEDISPSATRMVEKGMKEARDRKADLVIIDMDTYGGLLSDADSIRKSILNAEMPVYVFINKNAASAGALISIACDKIFMAPGATIGSATVVDQAGEVLPDKYQSYMRSIMRSTAESHGKDTVIGPNGDTTYVFKRNPKIAEAMVDERIVVPGVVDSGRIAAFTSSEAIEIGYSEGTYESISEILKAEQKDQYQIHRLEKTGMDKVIGFLSSPAIRGVLIMFIFWGIFFEIRTPGIGFPLLAAVICALLYFAPLYLDGLAANWEILLFVVGLILIGLEIFVIPGFGIAGISGIVLTVSSLILSLIRNVNFDFSVTSGDEVNGALKIVFLALVGFVVGLIVFGKGLMNSPLSKRLVLSDTLRDARVGTARAGADQQNLTGLTGITLTAIRPMGKMEIDGEIYECKSLTDFIDKGVEIRVTGRDLGYWLIEKA